jgi:hypothetical protein
MTTAADGARGITTYEIPSNLRAGSFRTRLIRPNGQEQRFNTDVFRIVSATIDQKTLRTGQGADFVYRFDFGSGPEREATVTIATTGPIQYERAAKRSASASIEAGRRSSEARSGPRRGR